MVQVIAKTKISHRNGFNAGKPTVLLQFNKDFEVGGDEVEARDDGSKMHPDSLQTRTVDRGGRLVSPSMHEIIHHHA